MTDIVERLRKIDSGDMGSNWYRNPDGPEAADEIERLRRIGTTEPCEKCNSPMMVYLQAKLAEARRLLEEITQRAWETSCLSNSMRYIEFTQWLTKRLLDAGYHPQAPDKGDAAHD